jgi:GntR family transcriptional regulator/MocR family aminotransferase
VSWELQVQIGEGDHAVFARIASAIADDIRRGRLAPGAELPGSRTLAASLGVHRNTVVAAYAELDAEGWITTRRAAGTFVSTALPDPRPRPATRNALRDRVPASLGFALPDEHIDDVVDRPRPAAGTIALYGGVPDLELLPIAELARAYRRALKKRDLLDYGDPRGLDRLRVALAGMLSSLRGLAATAADVLVTRGSQMALALAARAILRPGDRVAVEALGYRPAWAALRLAGAELVPVRVDGGGLVVDEIPDDVRAVYVTPHHQYPTTVVLAPGRRMALLALARARRLAIFEDDYDYEFHYEGRPVLPLASSDVGGVVAYIGTLSKILAPGLRLGFLVAPPALLTRVAHLRALTDRQGDRVVEHAVAELIEDGEVQRHARRMRRVYRDRREVMIDSLRREFGDRLELAPPAGGMALWAHAPGADVAAWAARALAAGALFDPGRRFSFTGANLPHLRLGFAGTPETKIREAVRRLRRCL